MALSREPMVGLDLRFCWRSRQDWWFRFSLCCATTHRRDGKLFVVVAMSCSRATETKAASCDWAKYSRDG
jgi:hypothetical protein